MHAWNSKLIRSATTCVMAVIGALAVAGAESAFSTNQITASPGEAVKAPAENSVLTFVQMTDSHITPSGIHNFSKQKVAKNLAAAVKDINTLNPAFVVITGDLVEDGLPEEYASLNNLLGGLKMPWHGLPGNHETIKGTWEDYKTHLKQPLYEAFEQNDCQFITLNGSKDDQKYHSDGFIDAEQMKWFEEQLEKGKNKLYTFVFCHFPLSPLHPKWKGKCLNEADREKVLALLKKYKAAAYIFGHNHGHDFNFADGLSQMLTASVGWNIGTQVGYRIFKVYPETTVSEWYNTGDPTPRYVLTIPNPRKLDLSQPQAVKAEKPALVKEDGLVACFKLDEGQGDVAFNIAGAGADGKIVAKGWKGAGWVDGKPGKAVYLYGRLGEHIDCGNDPTLNMGKDDFSIALWFKRAWPTDQKDSFQTLLFKSATGKVPTPGYGFLFRETGGEIKFTIADDKKIVGVTGPGVNDNKWHMVAGVRDRGKIKLYLDGKLVGEEPDTVAEINNAKNLTICGGGYPNNNGGPTGAPGFDGAIDEVRVYRKALADAEITKLFEGK